VDCRHCIFARGDINDRLLAGRIFGADKKQGLADIGIPARCYMLCHKTTCRVIYGDTDNMGQAYYGNYFRWFEIGRNEMFRSLGLTYKSVENRGIYLPVAEAHCKYSVPAQYDDVLVIETSLDTKIKGAIKFDYRVFSEEGQTLLARGYTKHACLNQEGKVIRPPKFIYEVIEKNLQQP
jgi:acyl-CoA thioester hydrolase